MNPGYGWVFGGAPSLSNLSSPSSRRETKKLSVDRMPGSVSHGHLRRARVASLCGPTRRTKYWLFMLQTVFDDHMVVRVPRNSCFITEAFDTTVTATLSINSSRERRYVILQTGREDTSDLLTVAVHFPFSQKLPAIFGRENLRGAWKCLSFSSSFRLL